MATAKPKTMMPRITKLLDRLTSSELMAIWNEIGYDADYKNRFFDRFIQDVTKLLDNNVLSERNKRDNLLEEIGELRKNILNLKSCLQSSLPIEPDESFSILELKEYLEKQKIVLVKEKYERLEKHNFLKLREDEVSKKLGIPPMSITLPLIPALDQLKDYENKIDFLEIELADRKRILEVARPLISSIMKEMDYHIQSDFEKSVFAENFLFSDTNMRGIESLKTDLKQQLEKMNVEANELRAKVVSLWHLLQISQEGQKLFLEKSSGQNVKGVVNILKREFDRCHELKLANMGKYIKEIRVEIAKYRKMMCIPEYNVAENCSYFQSETFTETLLETHEHELECLKKRYEEAEEIYIALQTRMNLWERKKILESNDFDPNRFTNRGGKMLPQLKERGKIEAQLSKLDGKIASDIEIWEQRKGGQFLIGERNIADFFQIERDVWEREKAYLKSEMKSQMENKGARRLNSKRGRELLDSPIISRKMAKVTESIKENRMAPPARHLFSSLKKSSKLPIRQQTAGTKDNPFSIVARI